jgi:hypothetical protein
MYDIPELEKKWRKYKRNQIKKPIIITLASVTILAGLGALSYTYIYPKLNKKSIAKNEQSVNKTKVANNTQTQQSSTNNEPAIIIKRESQSQNNNTNALVATKPTSSMDNANAQIDLSKATIIKPNVPDDEIRVIGFDNNKEKKAIENKYSDILIPKQSTQDIDERERISELEDKFQTSQDPQDSLEIARYYYKKKMYKKAEDWAVNTNNIDGDIEESWLIFAKARAKQGFRTDAIKVLQSFYDETNSIKAKKLLDKIRRGKEFN